MRLHKVWRALVRIEPGGIIAAHVANGTISRWMINQIRSRQLIEHRRSHMSFEHWKIVTEDLDQT
jgi:hypothetical protein